MSSSDYVEAYLDRPVLCDECGGSVYACAICKIKIYTYGTVYCNGKDHICDDCLNTMVQDEKTDADIEDKRLDRLDYYRALGVLLF